jgi:hypothetical protein
MYAPKQLLASVLLLLIISAISQYPGAIEARPLTLQQGKGKRSYSCPIMYGLAGILSYNIIYLGFLTGNSKRFFASLGLECKCCDGAKGECRSSWDSSCPKLKCHPWKSH